MKQYKILVQQYGLQFKKSDKIDLLCRDNEDSKQENVICFRTPTDNIDKNTFHKLRKLKFMTILQPIDFSQTEMRYFLMYKDVLQFCLNEENFTQQFKQIYGLKILLQLALTYDEFQKRNIHWPLTNINQLYFIEEMIYISLIEYEYGQKNEQLNMTPYKYLYLFIQKYFLDTFPELQYYLNFGNATDFKILDFLLQRNNNLHQINHLSSAPPYEDVLKYLLKVDNIKYISQTTNSVVGEFQTPKQLSNIYDLGPTIVYKSTMFCNDQFKDQIALHINREIELMEYMEQNIYMVVCFSYFRIKQYSFLLEKKYLKTLAEVMPSLKLITDKNQFKKGIYNIAYKFSLALNYMHDLNIIHRDLKPENLFVDVDDPSALSVFIADFDRSKKLENSVNFCQTQCDSNTICYDPPETEQTLKYDIFQFGLILLNVANRGVYVGERCGPRSLDIQQKFEQYYSQFKIEQILQKEEFGEEFINLIVNCLQKNHNQRPNAKQTQEILQKIYFSTKIIVIPQIKINQQNQNTSQQQLFSFNSKFSQSNNNINNYGGDNYNSTNNTNNNNGYLTQQFQTNINFQSPNNLQINLTQQQNFCQVVFNFQNQQNQAQQQNQYPSYFGPYLNKKK